MKNKKISYLLVSIFFLIPFSVLAFDYKPMENIPGFEGVSTLPEYLMAIYKFGIWTIGLAAMLMIMIGGYMYIMSAGNTASVGKAKGVITDAIFGLILALTSYLLLYTINPELTVLNFSGSGGGATSGNGNGKIPSATDIAACQAWCDQNWSSDPDGLSNCKKGCDDPKGYTQESRLAACNSWCDKSGYTGDELNSCKKGCEDYAASANASAGKYSNAAMPSNCNDPSWQGIFSKTADETGVDKCILQATAAMESGCTKVPKRTLNGRDCSVVQIAAQANCNQTCDYLEQNPDAAVKCAANYLKSCSSLQRAGNIQDVYAGYNGGCGALKPSSNCPGQKRWDCNINPGGYAAVPARTAKFENYYNQCKNK